MSIIIAIFAGLFIWFICANAVPDTYKWVTENGKLIGAVSAFLLWIFPYLMDSF